MKTLKTILFNLNEIQYLKPIKVYIDIEGLGEREFITTSKISSNDKVADGIVEFYAVYGNENDPTATTFVEVNVITREVLNSPVIHEQNDYLVEQEIKDFEVPSYGSVL